jgi:TonB-dependent receptor
MRLRFLFLVSSILLCLSSFAQIATVTGKVTNEKNEPLSNVSVSINGSSVTSTGSDGSYQLRLDPGMKYELTFSSVGYETKVVGEVEARAHQLNELNVVLKVITRTEVGVVVTARTTQRRETVNSLLQFQKNTNTVASVISAETIRRSPDRNTGEVLKRTPGTSLQEGKFIIVRGLADRYNQAMLDGVLLTSTEPDRKTFSFDLIPSSMIDNIVINKAFVPEYPGEWAGGLIQVNTKDIPSRNFFNIQVGTGYNPQTTFKSFYRDADGGQFDWLGFDDGTRALPALYTTKTGFDTSSAGSKIGIGTALRNSWSPERYSAPLNISFQANGGFSGRLFGKKIGAIAGLVYNKSNRYQDALNRRNVLNNTNETFTVESNFDDQRFIKDIAAGALGSLSVQFNSLNKVTLKSILNVNNTNSVIRREGIDISRPDFMLQGTEITFRQNTFFTAQINGEHTVAAPVKLKWYGAFTILDGYSPDQRRLLYSRQDHQDVYTAVIANSLSQQSGSRIFQSLSDYIYTAGGDLSWNFNAFGQKQTLKGGYMFQVKDRLYDAQLFANYLPRDNPALRQLTPDKIFDRANFGDGTDNKFAFDAIKNKNFRYLANTILNGGYLQFDNQVSNAIRIVWGLRVENYDQLVGSTKVWDPRYSHTEVTDFLPGLNATFRINPKTNIRLSGSQTVIRPELRELSFLNLYDFELNASVQGLPSLQRTKVTNADLRYEIYPGAGEVITVGMFYKHFEHPIEQYYNEGVGGSSTFNFLNANKASSYGGEIEFRKKLDFASALKNFTFQTNVAYINSRIKDTARQIDRPMQGQSPYTLNLGLLYDLEKEGLTATLLFNQVGHRIYLVGDKSAGAGSPDIYEAPRALLDLQVAKTLLNKRAEVKFNVSDILNRTQYFYQNANPNKDQNFQKEVDAYRFTRKFGTTFSISFNYSL